MENYKNKDLSIHERTIDLLNRLTLKEKVGQVNQHLYGWKIYEKNIEGEFILTDYFKEHVKRSGGIGALYGLFRADPWSQVNYDNGISPEESKAITQMVQEYVTKNSRLGLPVLFVEECPHGHQGLDSVSYPTNIGRGAMFDKTLVETMSRHMAEELAYKGVHIGLVSTLDLARDPRWGRTEECFGEDPHLASEYTKAVVKGFQGEMISPNESFVDKTVKEIDKQEDQIGVVLKHFIGQGEALGGHNSGDVSIGPRELYDTYYELMNNTKNAVGVMAAYNDLDGLPCHSNPFLLTELLKENIGFQGLVMADGGAIDRLLVGDDSYEEKAKLALEAGVDLSLWDHSYLSIEEGVNNGRIKEESLNKAVYRVLSIKFLLGLFDKEITFEKTDDTLFKKKQAEWQSVNLKAAVESLCLVKNEESTLPIKRPKKMAVIGPNAHNLYNQLGDYTPPQSYKYSSTILEGLQKEFKDSEIVYNEGCAVRSDQESIAEAVEQSKDADVIILVLGGSSTRDFGADFMDNGAVNRPEENMDSGENIDVASLALGGYQLDLLKRLSQLSIPIVSVLIQGRPYELREVFNYSKAVLVGWYPGQRGGEAIASVIAGKSGPGGKLPVSIPYSSEQLPVYYNQKRSLKKADYFDLPGKAFLPFGYGLSYSAITCSDLIIRKRICSVDSLLKGESIEVNVTLYNQGKETARESVLCYLEQHGTPVLSREKKLVYFDKPSINAGQKKICSFHLNADMFKQLDFNYKETIFPSTVVVKVNGLESKITITE